MHKLYVMNVDATSKYSSHPYHQVQPPNSNSTPQWPLPVTTQEWPEGCDKEFNPRPGLQIPQIQIQSSICGTYQNKSYP